MLLCVLSISASLPLSSRPSHPSLHTTRQQDTTATFPSTTTSQQQTTTAATTEDDDSTATLPCCSLIPFHSLQHATLLSVHTKQNTAHTTVSPLFIQSQLLARAQHPRSSSPDINLLSSSPPCPSLKRLPPQTRSRMSQCPWPPPSCQR
jgi:hypothetical protein